VQLRCVLYIWETHDMISFFLIQERCFDKSEQQQPSYLHFLHYVQSYLKVKQPDADGDLFVSDTLQS
jgi:hypothetical protein